MAEIVSISITWTIMDILHECPWVTQESASDILSHLKENHDATIGINWDVIRDTVDNLIPTEQAIKDIAKHLQDIVNDLYGEDDSWDIAVVARELHDRLYIEED